MIGKKKILITGASGFVGSVLAHHLSGHHTIFTPTHSEMDCTNRVSVQRYIRSHTPDCIIHAAAYTDISKAEYERGNTEGMCYTVNVLGTRYMIDAAQSVGARSIYVSTGSVFAGTIDKQGPFTEEDPHAAIDDLSWYGATKAIAESYVIGKGSIVRLSHPLSIDRSQSHGTSDYLDRMLALLQDHQLYPLFHDQLFPVSDLFIVAKGMLRCIESETIGTYHMVSTDLVSPYTLCTYAARLRGMDCSGIASVSFDDFIKGVAQPRRYAKYIAMSGVRTNNALDLPSYTWKDVVHTQMLDTNI